jgi:hypothetical protein
MILPNTLYTVAYKAGPIKGTTLVWAQGDLNPVYSRVQPPRILDLFRTFLKIGIRHFSSWMLIQMTVHT